MLGAFSDIGRGKLETPSEACQTQNPIPSPIDTQRRLPTNSILPPCPLPLWKATPTPQPQARNPMRHLTPFDLFFYVSPRNELLSPRREWMNLTKALADANRVRALLALRFVETLPGSLNLSQ